MSPIEKLNVYIEQLRIESARIGGQMSKPSVAPNRIKIQSLGKRDSQYVLDGYNVDLTFVFPDETSIKTFNKYATERFDEVRKQAADIRFQDGKDDTLKAMNIHFYWLAKETQ